MPRRKKKGLSVLPKSVQNLPKSELKKLQKSVRLANIATKTAQQAQQTINVVAQGLSKRKRTRKRKTKRTRKRTRKRKTKRIRTRRR